MQRQKLRSLPLGESLIADVSQLLDSGDAPSVLWGNHLLTVYGIPSLSNDAAFAIPDGMIPRVREILQTAGLDLCTSQNSIVMTVRFRPPSTNHFRLEADDDIHVSLYPQSEVLPNISNIREAVGSQIIYASDTRLPKGPRIGYGKGVFSSYYGQCVHVPSTACFLEACLINFARLARKMDYQCPHDLHYMGWASYMIKYVYPGGYLDLDSLQENFREFMVDAILRNSAESFVAARAKIIAFGV